jgi:hypothetical protein
MGERLTALLLLLLLALTGCNRGQSPSKAREEMSAVEYEVLSAWLGEKITAKARDNGLSQIVIYDTTDPDYGQLLRDDNGQPIPWNKGADSLRKKASLLQQSALDAYQKVNTHPAFLRHSLHSLIDYRLVSSAQLKQIICYHCGFWPAYYKQFPGSQGLLTFSRVGFSADGAQAFFYYSNRCEGLCGKGEYVFMERHNGHWAIQQEIGMWVS